MRRPYDGLCSLDAGWVFFVVGPMGWVVADVLTDGVQFSFVANDAFVVVALPDAEARAVPDAIDAPRCHRFEIADDRAQGSRRRTGCL